MSFGSYAVTLKHFYQEMNAENARTCKKSIKVDRCFNKDLSRKLSIVIHPWSTRTAPGNAAANGSQCLNRTRNVSDKLSVRFDFGVPTKW